jgi:hypothetical protein
MRPLQGSLPPRRASNARGPVRVNSVARIGGADRQGAVNQDQ